MDVCLLVVVICLMCEFLFRYDGDCDIGVAVSFLEAGIKDLRLRGLMRIELKPLIDRLPLVGAVSVSFVKDPVSIVIEASNA